MRAFRSVTVALLIGAALVLSITAGGAPRFVKTYGTSMEPSFQAGDLAVLRQSSRYKVGDVAAYRSPDLGKVVLHRIVERQGDVLLFKGDNNDFVDRERITSADLMGRLALRVPRGGRVLSWIQQPLHAVPLAAALSALPIVCSRRKRHLLSPILNPTRGNPMKPFTVVQLQRATPWLAAGAVASLLVGAMSVSGAAATTPEARVLTHMGSFDYSAASSSSLYPNGFGTGDPVFTRLSDRVAVEFTYEAQSAAEVDARGSVSLDAVLSGSGGWRRTEALSGPQPVEDGAATVRAELDLTRLQHLGVEAAAITGTHGGEIRIELTPVVRLSGTVGGHRLDDKFAPALAFSLDGAALRPAAPSDGTTGGFEQSRDVTFGDPAPSGRTPAGVFAAVLPAWSGPGFLAGGLLMTLAAAYGHFGVGRSGGPNPVSRRYAHLLVPVEGVAAIADRSTIEVASMEALVRLAKHHGYLVLHQMHEGGHYYIVQLLGTTYVYRPEAAPPRG